MKPLSIVCGALFLCVTTANLFAADAPSIVKVWTIPAAIVGTTGFLIAWLLSVLVPLR